MKKNLPSVSNGNSNRWKKNNIIYFKKLNLTVFVSAFVFLVGFLPGNSFAQPAVPQSFTATAASDVQINLTATANSANNNILVVFNTIDNFGTPDPATSYKSGDPVSGGGTVWYIGSAASLPNHTGLTAGTKYFYKAFSYDGSSYSSGITDNATTKSTTCTPPATPDPTSNSPVCVGNTIDLSTAAVSGATYAWTGPGGYTSTSRTPSISNATTADGGTYSVTVTVGSCTSAAGTVTVAVNAAPATPDPTSNSPVCVGNTIDLSTAAVSGATYAWTGSGGYTSTSRTPSISNATTADGGTYSVTVTIGSCTSAAGTVTVAVNAAPATPDPTSNSPVCVGNTIDLSTAAVSGATYAWTGPGGYTSTSRTPSISNATTADGGTYSVTVTVGSCTSAAGTVTVAVNAAPATPDPTSNSPVCVGSTIDLSTAAVSGATYAWTGPGGYTSTSRTPSISNATTADGGTYSVTVTIGSCTSAAGTVTVAVNAAPATPDPTSNSPVCVGSTIDLSTAAVSGATYAWTGPGGYTSTSRTPSISNATTADGGTYSVTVTVGSCTSAAGTVTVAVNAAPATPDPTSNSPVCVGNTIDLSTAAVSGATYAWTGPGGYTSTSRTPSISNATTADGGTYSVTVTIGSCTSAAGTVTVAVNAAPATPDPTSNSPVCVGNTIDLSTAAVSGATYAWTGPGGYTSTSRTPSISNATTADGGTYSVTVTIGSCTSAAGTVTVAVNAAPATPDPTSNSPVCVGNTIDLSTAAVSGATYAWTGPGGYTSTSRTPSISNATTADGGIYSVTVTVGSCTSAAGTVTVAVNAAPATPDPTSNSPVCVGSTIDLSTAAVSGATYAWTGPGGYTSTSRTPSISNATTADGGTYSVTVTVGSCTSAAGTVTVAVNAPPSATISYAGSTFCTSVTTAQPVTRTGTTGGNYSSTNGLSISASTGSITPSTSTAGTYTVTYTMAASGGCSAQTATTSVTITDPPTATISYAGTPFCKSVSTAQSVTRTGTSGGTYSSTTGLSISSTTGAITPSTSTAGTYTVTYTMAASGGCSPQTATTSVTITAVPAATISYAGSTFCTSVTTAQPVTRTGTAGGTYSSTNGLSINASTGSITPNTSTAGTYTVTYTMAASGGCSAQTATTSVTMTDPPSATISYAGSPFCKSITTAQPVTRTGTAGGTYSSTTGLSISSTTGAITPSTSTAGTYTVTYTMAASGGCSTQTATTSVTITAVPAATISYAGSTFCTSVTTAQPVTRTGTSGGTYSSATGLSIDATTGAITPSTSTAATYTVTYTMAASGGCSAQTATTSVTITAPPSATISYAGSPFCRSITTAQPVTRTGTAGGTYSSTTGLSISATTGAITPSTSTAGTYTVTYTMAASGGCSAQTATTSVAITAVPTITATTPGSTCGPGTVDISATSSGNTIKWYTASTGGNSIATTASGSKFTTPFISTTTTYYAEASTSGGCASSSRTAVVASVGSAPTANAGQDITSCADVNQTTTGSSISIGTGATASTSNIEWTASGNGTIGSPTSLNGATYTPSTGEKNNGGIITLTLTAKSTGCADAVSTKTLTLTPAIVESSIAWEQRPTCSGLGAQFTVIGTPSGGNGTYSYQWQNKNNCGNGQGPSTPVDGATNSTFIPNVDGCYWLQVKSGGCTLPINYVAGTKRQKVDATVTASSNINFSTASDTIICNGESTVLTPQSGISYTYSWSPDPTLTTTGSTATVTPTATTTYTVTGTTTDANGSTCTRTRNVTVTVNPTPDISNAKTSACGGTAFTVTPTGTGVPTGTTYTWGMPVYSSNSVGGGSAQSTGQSSISQTLTNSSATPETATYTVTPATTSCSGHTFTVEVTVNPAPFISDQPAVTTCNGTPFTVTPTGSGVPNGTTYTWGPPSIDPNGSLKGGSAQTSGTTSISQALTLNGSATTGTATYTVIPTFGTCQGSSFTITVTVGANKWIGVTDLQWITATNWTCGVPSDGDDIVISSTANFMPSLDANTNIGSLTFEGSGQSLSLNNYNLTVNGTISGTGELVGSTTSSLALKGTSTIGTLNFKQSGGSNVLKNLTLATGTVTLGNDLFIYGLLAPNAGTLNSAGHLTLGSSSIAATASVGEVTGGGISGAVTVERFIPARRSYRFISPSVTGGSIRANWMEGGLNPDVFTIDNPNPGYGTNITGPGANANGFDPTITNNPSLYVFNEGTQKWDSVKNTNGTLSAGAAYSLMIRGSRSTKMWDPSNNPPATNTILRAKGTLFSGTKNVSLGVSSGNYAFIGNPYASPVDFEQLMGTANNVAPSYYAWDPRLNVRGAYVTYNLSGHSNNNGSSDLDQNIQSGQAFLVKASGASSSISFREAYKSTGNTAVFRDPHPLTKLSIQLLLSKDEAPGSNADGVVSLFDSDFSAAIGDEDSYKFTNPDENLAINHNGISLSMEGRPPVTADDTIALKIWQFRQKSYYLKLTGSNFAPEVTAFVNDNYLHKQTSVDLAAVTYFAFTIDTTIASFAKDRFSIVFKAGKPLPVTLTHIKAYQKDQGIQVDWTSETETNVDHYEIEKSANGQQFTKATVIAASGNNAVAQTYGWFDTDPNTGSNFYRIKVIDKSGVVKYSNAVKVDIAAVNSSITILPNPIKGNVIQVKFANMEKGRYSAVLYNTLGQKLNSNVIEHTALSGIYRISLGRLISKGTYTLNISKGDVTINKRIIVE